MKKLKGLLAFNCHALNEKKDSLGFMSKMRKKVNGVIMEADQFIKTVHKDNPYKGGVRQILETHQQGSVKPKVRQEKLRKISKIWIFPPYFSFFVFYGLLSRLGT